MQLADLRDGRGPIEDCPRGRSGRAKAGVQRRGRLHSGIGYNAASLVMRIPMLLLEGEACIRHPRCVELPVGCRVQHTIAMNTPDF